MAGVYPAVTEALALERLEHMQREAAAMRQQLGDRHAGVVRAQSEIEALKQRMASFEAGQVRPRLMDGRSVIDTSFSMEIGETVVVGTSRIRGGDKALIALLTAVPKGRRAARNDAAQRRASLCSLRISKVTELL